MPWAFKTVGFRGTPAGDLPLLVFVREDGDDRALEEQLTEQGLGPLPADVEDLLRPMTAAVDDGRALAHVA
ncbi:MULTISPECIES: hypothetical protein [Streptomyces]|uniref:hypothetical protein n=1 Tax=Streptomyces TaxID=1883 RepID=UPI00099065DA|nr:hypothetical protein [Streptomyces sp. fd1-xmd]AQT75567.1 hypothetical protein B1K54_31600 [Streptomyces sp. fd1-xmd]